MHRLTTTILTVLVTLGLLLPGEARAFTGLPTITDRIRLNENVVRAGVNYKF